MTQKVQIAQLSEFKFLFYYKKEIVQARELIRNSLLWDDKINIEVALFRDSNYSEEGAKRVAHVIASLLNLYSTLEIGAISGAFPSNLDLEVMIDCADCVSSNSVRLFCEGAYKSKLPLDLLNRYSEINKSSLLMESNESTQLFNHFLTIKNYYEELSEARFFIKKFNKKSFLNLVDRLRDVEFILAFNEDYLEFINSNNEYRFFQSYMDYMDFVKMVYHLFEQCNRRSLLSYAFANYFNRMFTLPDMELIGHEVLYLLRNYQQYQKVSSFATEESLEEEENVIKFINQFDYIKDRIYDSLEVDIFVSV